MNIHYFISGVVHKLKHHLGDFGSTGAMCCTGDLLACAGYDLDNGLAYINCECKFTTIYTLSQNYYHGFVKQYQYMWNQNVC